MMDIDEAVEADHAALVWRIRSFRGASGRRDARGQHVWSGLASGFFNNTILARLPDDPRREVAELVDEARGRGVPWRFYISGASTPRDLVRHLEDAGLARGRGGRSMRLDGPLNEPPPVEGLRIEAVDDAAGLERWLAVRVAGEAWPPATTAAWRSGQGHVGSRRDGPVRTWIGRIGADDVAIVALQHEPAADVAGVYHVVTVPTARRRGIASAMTAHAVSTAWRKGARRVVLSATRMAERTYARLGFVGAGEFTYWYDEDLGA